MSDILSSEEALDAFLDAFERGTWPKSAWTHAAHVTVATSYALEYPLDEATNRIRQGIQHYNRSVGTVNSDHSGYHETLTVFWMAVVRAQLAGIPVETPRIEAVRAIVDDLGSRRDLFKEHYSFDVVRSVEARRSWVAPDLKPLP